MPRTVRWYRITAIAYLIAQTGSLLFAVWFFSRNLLLVVPLAAMWVAMFLMAFIQYRSVAKKIVAPTEGFASREEEIAWRRERYKAIMDETNAPLVRLVRRLNNGFLGY